MDEGESGHSNDDIVEEATLSLRAASSGTMEASASVHNNANQTRIKNGSFSTTTNVFNLSRLVHVFFAFLFLALGILYSPVSLSPWSKSPDTQREVLTNTMSGLPASASLESLYKMVAPNAILNAGVRADEVRCHPGTRKQVIDIIETFMDGPVERTRPIFWLNGPAGTCKTVIMQTIAERSKARGVPHANFFFFRMDKSRSNATALVATLVYQIIQFSPAMRNAVAAALTSHPLLFQMGLREQFNILMHEPCSAISHTESPCRPVVLFIDGLDKCDSENKITQARILQALDGVLSREGVPFRVIIASRPEPQIAMAFEKLHSEVEVVALGEIWAPQIDIQHFVTKEFSVIKSTHFLGGSLPADWPSPWDVDDIVRRSSGQFIYAATVMRYIKHSPSSPALSLRGVQGIASPAKHLPFGHLDSLYTYILQQAHNPVVVKILLACSLLAQYPELATLKACLNAYHPEFSEDVMFSAIADLASIAQIGPGRDRGELRPKCDLQFYHPSFADFLQDKSRAAAFFMDLSAFSNAIFPSFWSAADRYDIAMLFFAKTIFVEGVDHHQWFSVQNKRQSVPNEVESFWLVTESLNKIKVMEVMDYRNPQLPVAILEVWGEALDFFLLLETQFHNDQIAFSLVLQAWKYRMATSERSYVRKIRGLSDLKDLKDLFEEHPERRV